MKIQRKARIKASHWGKLEEMERRHFSLRLPLYSWCTSPIRRYTDIIAQRLITKACKKTPNGEIIHLDHIRNDNNALNK